MLKIKTNLYILNDESDEAYPVEIMGGNIIPIKANKLPKCADDMVNFKYDFSKLYTGNFNKKINVRFRYPFCGGYKKRGTEGYCKAFAYLTPFQRIILSFIAKTSIFHKHLKFIVRTIIALMVAILLYLGYFYPRQKKQNQSEIPQKKQHTMQAKEEAVDSLTQRTDVDTLKAKQEIIKEEQ